MRLLLQTVNRKAPPGGSRGRRVAPERHWPRTRSPAPVPARPGAWRAPLRNLTRGRGWELPFLRGCSSVAAVAHRDSNDCIRLRGARQNNLKGFDLDLPLGKYIVVTGLSGAGKSSLVFDTLHAEGQRRYVETFSAYTRQFLELLPKPRVDSIENIRPSIAIQQTNTVKTSRSTVGTMTELTDFFKVWFSHVAECFDPETGEKVEDDHPASIWRKTRSALSQATVVVAFKVAKPHNLAWPEILKNLKVQSYVRVLVPAPSDGGRQRQAEEEDAPVHRIDDLLADPQSLFQEQTHQQGIPATQGRIGLGKQALCLGRSD